MSGIYIHGMDIPKHGSIVLVEVDENGDVYAAYDSGITKLAQYKAIAVPPHGRLIDADALAKDLDYDVELDSRLLDDINCVGNEREHTQFDKDCKQNFMLLLTEAPTIISASE